jgi:hypothetical protein
MPLRLLSVIAGGHNSFFLLFEKEDISTGCTGGSMGLYINHLTKHL